MNTTAQHEIDAYVEAVREALVGLPETTRQELIEDLPEHLAEVLAEGAGSLVDRLGPPQFYAAELRAAAGFVGGFPDPPPPNDRLAQAWVSLRTAVGRHAQTADVRIGPLLGHARASEFFALLRPAWWVLRGYLAAMVLAYLLDDSGQPIGLLPRIGGSEPVALLLLAGAVLASIWLGRRTAALTAWPRYAVRSGAVLLSLVAFTLFVNADRSSRDSVYQHVGYTDPFGGVSDIFVYDRQGRLLTDVQLLNQDGAPIRVGSTWCADKPDQPDVVEYRYPHCPQNAPFRMGPAPTEPTVTPTADSASRAAPPASPGTSSPGAPAPRASSPGDAAPLREDRAPGQAPAVILPSVTPS